MVGHETFFHGSIAPANGARLALPRPDYRWRHVAQRTFSPEPIDFPEEEDFVEQQPETSSASSLPPSPEPLTPPRIPEAEQAHSAEPPHIKLLKIAQMYGEGWRPAKIATSEDKSYAVLLPRDSKLSLEQAIKRRQAIIIVMDGNGKITVQDLRAVSSHRKLSWWQRIFRWR